MHRHRPAGAVFEVERIAAEVGYPADRKALYALVAVLRKRLGEVVEPVLLGVDAQFVAQVHQTRSIHQLKLGS